jgi:hypothetical protein
MQVENPMSAARRVTLMVIPVAPKRLARWQSTCVIKTTLAKLNCSLPSLPARGQRRRRATVPMTARACAPMTCAILINPRAFVIPGF